MEDDSLSDQLDQVLDQAELAAQAQDWALLNRLLLQLVSTLSEASHPAEEESPILQSQPPVLTQCLQLAMQSLEQGDFQSRWDSTPLFSHLGKVAIPSLLALIHHPEAVWESKWFAIRLLGGISDASVPPALIQLLIQRLEEAKPPVSPDTDEAEDGEDDVSAVIIEALIQQGNAAISALQTLLNHPNTRSLGIQALSRIRTRATLEPLLTVVQDADPNIRAIAVEALSSFHDPKIAPVLVHALEDASSQVRKVAVEGLGLRPELNESIDLAPMLAKYLWDWNIEVAQQAAIAVGRLRNPAVLPELLHCLCAPSTPRNLQIKIVHALAWMDSTEAVSSLKKLLLNPEIAITLSTPIHVELAHALGEIRTPQVQAAETGIYVLRSALSSGFPWLTDTAVQQALIVSLGQLQQWQAVEVLVQCLASPHLTLRLHAIAALKQLDAERSRSYLMTVQAQPHQGSALNQEIREALDTWQ